MKPGAYFRSIGNHFGFRRAQPDERPSLRPRDEPPPPYRFLRAPIPLPLTAPPGSAAVNGERLSASAAARLARELGGEKRRITLFDRRQIASALQDAYAPQLAEHAANSLRARQPRFSAALGMPAWQIMAMLVASGLCVGGAVFAPRDVLVVYCVALSLMFLITISLRIAAAAYACRKRFWSGGKRIRRLPDAQLPRYTVMVAMYREARVLPQLVDALKALRYPPAKLDIILVLEAVDAETLAAARSLVLPPHFSILAVPDGAPRTKPRALNYALQFATGDFVVIYDAEDRPDPDQLRKAAGHFRDATDEVVCLQARLTFDNASENWLAKQFTIEYASLFGGILPMLDAARLPLPLGGTSNHFRASVLRKLGGWDAFNVTEDADLGMRIYRRGLRAEMLDSTTFEEAACQPGNWLRQRTRWLKGWMQTYSVHMRQPVRLLRELGPSGFIAFQGHFAGIIVAALVHPLSYLILLADLASGMAFAPADSFWARQIWMIALFNLIAGYAASLALGLSVLKGKRVGQLAPQLIFIPFYWLLISAAAYRAVYQLIKAPHYWEKTEHGLSKMSRAKSEVPK